MTEHHGKSNNNGPPSSSSCSQSSTAEETSLQCPKDHDLRVSCYCEENAWRLIHRHLHSKYLQNNTDSTQNVENKQWNYHAIFISNEEKCCPMFMQRARPNGPEEYVCWDYHVIVMRTRVEKIMRSHDEEGKNDFGGDGDNVVQTEILDIDTWLTPYPCPLKIYLDGTFPHVDEDLNPKYLPLFRVVPAEDYLKYFYSDRMHMYNATTGEWNSPPPAYQPIMNGLQFASEKEERLKREITIAKCNNSSDSSDSRNSKNVSNLDSYISMSQNGVEKHTGLKRYGEVLTIDELRSHFA